MDPFEQLKNEIDKHNQHLTEDDRIERCFYNTFSTPEGEKCLKYMCQIWLDTQLFVPNDPYTTSYNLGHADLINFIKDCVNTVKGVDNDY
jgi:hypothetical protein